MTVLASPSVKVSLIGITLACKIILLYRNLGAFLHRGAWVREGGRGLMEDTPIIITITTTMFYEHYIFQCSYDSES